MGVWVSQKAACEGSPRVGRDRVWFSRAGRVSAPERGSVRFEAARGLMILAAKCSRTFSRRNIRRASWFNLPTLGSLGVNPLVSALRD